MLYIKLTHPFRKSFRREKSVIGRQRLSLLLFCYIPIMVIGVLANFLDITEPSASFFGYTHSLCIVSAIVSFYLFYKRKINITVCLAAFTIIGQTIISVEMIYCAFQDTHYYNMLIMANMVLLSLNTLVSTAGYMKRNTALLGIASVVIYIACSLITGDGLLKGFIVVFILVFVFASIVGVWVSDSIGKLEHENKEYRKDETEVLHILRLKRNEVKTFISLASEKYSHNWTKVMLERLDTKSRNNLISNVEEYLKSRDTDLDIITKVFPKLTPSEREICRLILQGKKLGDICIILNKNESNINSQRANMRRKLGLKPADNLQKVLQQQLDKAK